MPLPKVTIIILNWNRKDDTVECLQSARKITYPDYNVILVDNGSDDGSQLTVSTQFPEVKLIENRLNLGFAGGMNVGIRSAIANGAEHVFILNNDTTLDSVIITELLKAYVDRKDVCAAVPKIYQYYRPDRIDSCGLDINYGPHIGRVRGNRRPDGAKYSKLEEVEGLTGCGVLIKKSALNKVGLFDEDFFFYGEDVDLSLRFRKAGYKIIFVPNAKMWHKVSSAAGDRPNPLKGKHIGEASIRCMKKHAGPKEWAIFISKSAFLFPVALFNQTLKGNFRAFWAKSMSAFSSILKLKH